MTLTELAALASLIEELNVSTDNHDVITAFTEWLEKASPHGISAKSLEDLDKVTKKHFINMNHGDNLSEEDMEEYEKKAKAEWEATEGGILTSANHSL